MGNDSFFIVLLVLVGGMWLLSRNQRKQQKKAQSFRDTLAVGQEVMTGSGMFGEVVDVDGDIITIESAPGSRSRWLRAAIAKVVEPPVDDEIVVDDAEVDGIEVPDDLSSLDETDVKTDVEVDDETDVVHEDGTNGSDDAPTDEPRQK